MSKRTLILDSSQIQTFLECPQLWFYQYILNLQKTESEPREVMHKGIYGHKLLELYYKSRVLGSPLFESIEDSIRHDIDQDTPCVTCSHNESSHSLIHLSNGSPALAKCSACSATPNYLHAFEHAPFPLSQLSRQQVQERFRLYALTTEKHDFTPLSTQSIECGFSHLLYEDSDHLFVLEGKIDLIASLNNNTLLVDHKFQERATTLYKKSIQFRNYSLATGVRLMIINYIRLAKSADKPFERSLISFSHDELTWWRQELINIYFNILKHLDSIQSNRLTLPGAQHWNNCMGRYGQLCSYTDLCESRDQRLVQVLINNNYIKKESWRPWS